jgi:hypothetical protein
MKNKVDDESTGANIDDLMQSRKEMVTQVLQEKKSN